MQPKETSIDTKFLAILLSVLIITLSACVEETSLPDLAPDGLIVIEGRITNERKRHQVKVTKSFHFEKEQAPAFISGLNVVIESQSAIIPLKETSPGIYITDSIAGIPGQAYTLKIKNGEELYEATDIMPGLPGDFSPATFKKDRGFLDYEFRRHQFGFEEANYWELRLIRDSIPEQLRNIDPSQLGQLVGVTVDADYSYLFAYYTHSKIEVSGLMDFEIPHFFGLNPGFRVVHKKYNLSDEYYRFLRALFMETEWRGTIFSTTPANVKGNIEGNAVGFFNAVSVKEKMYTPE